MRIELEPGLDVDIVSLRPRRFGYSRRRSGKVWKRHVGSVKGEGTSRQNLYVYLQGTVEIRVKSALSSAIGSSAPMSAPT